MIPLYFIIKTEKRNHMNKKETRFYWIPIFKNYNYKKELYK